MNVLSLFDGMSCGQLALDRAGIPYKNYYASEIDKYAIQITQKNYPDTIQMGDILGWQSWDLDWGDIDLIIGGSPCQGFSVGGKKKKFKDPRSKLFFVYVAILRHVRKYNPPVKFLLENVKMDAEDLDRISEYLDTPYEAINSSLVSAQLRSRMYWMPWNAPQPEDKGLSIADIREHDVEDRYYLSEKALRGFDRKTQRRRDRPSAFSTMNVRRNDQKSTCISARYHKSGIGDAMVNDVKGIRRFTPTEVERLQTVPDGYTEGVSNTQRLTMLGNGWTVDVIAHILKHGDF